MNWFHFMLQSSQTNCRLLSHKHTPKGHIFTNFMNKFDLGSFLIQRLRCTGLCSHLCFLGQKLRSRAPIVMGDNNYP